MKSHSCMFFLEGCVFCEYLASSFRDIRSLQDTNLSDHYAPQVPAITSTVRESREAVAAAATPLEVAPKVEAYTARVLSLASSCGISRRVEGFVSCDEISCQVFENDIAMATQQLDRLGFCFWRQGVTLECCQLLCFNFKLDFENHVCCIC